MRFDFFFWLLLHTFSFFLVGRTVTVVTQPFYIYIFLVYLCTIFVFLPLFFFLGTSVLCRFVTRGKYHLGACAYLLKGMWGRLVGQGHSACPCDCYHIQGHVLFKMFVLSLCTGPRVKYFLIIWIQRGCVTKLSS